jgi:hypothetical protein
MAVSQRDDFTGDTIRKLGERVGLLCSNPDCRVPTKGPHTSAERAASVGQGCHINAAASGGPRYEPSQSEDERRSIHNGIWLCSNCGTLVDNDAARFPAVLLRVWKAQAELEAAEGIGRRQAKQPDLPSPSGGADERWRRCGNVYWLGHNIMATAFDLRGEPPPTSPAPFTTPNRSLSPQSTRRG